jgi:hypothetical protein
MSKEQLEAIENKFFFVSLSFFHDKATILAIFSF